MYTLKLCRKKIIFISLCVRLYYLFKIYVLNWLMNVREVDCDVISCAKFYAIKLMSF